MIVGSKVNFPHFWSNRGPFAKHSGLANAVSQILIFSTKLFPNVGSYVSRKPPKTFGFLTFYFRSNRRFSKSHIWVKTQFLPNLHNSISKKIDFSVKMMLFLKKERFAGLDLYILIYYILIGKKWHITIFLQTVPFWVKRHLVFFHLTYYIKIDFLVKMSLFLKTERCGDQALYILIYYILIGKKWHITLDHRTVRFWVKRHLVFFHHVS